jgi:hypothetical protein
VEEDTIAGGALAPGEKPAQILICRKRKKRRQESLAFLVELLKWILPSNFQSLRVCLPRSLLGAGSLKILLRDLPVFS